MRAGQRLEVMSDGQLERVFDHPAQRRNVQRVAELIAQMRGCSSAADFVEFQRALFQSAFEVDDRRARCKRTRPSG